MTLRQRLLGLLFLGSFALTAHAVIDQVIDRTFELKADAVVSVDTFSGGITVGVSDAPQMRVLVRQTVEADDDEAAQALLAKLEVKLEQTKEGGVTLKIVPRHAVRWTWQNWSPAALAVEVTVPRTARLDLRTGEGAVSVAALKGEVSAKVGTGSIFVGEIDGSITAWNGRGDVSVTACSGPLKLTARNGSVLVGRTGARAELAAVDGVIEVQAARGPVVARGNRADIKVSFAHPLTQPSDLDADGGDVTAGLDPRSALTLHARASGFGSVRVRDLEILSTKGKPGDTALTGTLNGGGPALTIRASGGNVRINAVPSL